MNLSDFLSPVSSDKIKPENGYCESHLGAIITRFKEEGSFPDMEGVNLAIIGVEDDRNAISNEGCAQAPDAVREYLYELSEGSFQSKIADLGNIRAGESA